MQIGTTTSTNPYLQNTMSETDTKTLKEKIQSGEVSAKAISQAYLVEYSLKVQSYSSDNIQAQNATLDLTKIRNILKNVDLKSLYSVNCVASFRIDASLRVRIVRP